MEHSERLQYYVEWRLRNPDYHRNWHKQLGPMTEKRKKALIIAEQERIDRESHRICLLADDCPSQII